MKKAFTLIELLVVIAIIAILAAILFPVFAQAKAAAKKTAALSNTKNIATAGFLYSGDNDDQFPAVYDGGDANNRGGDPICTMFPYIKNMDIWSSHRVNKNPARMDANGNCVRGNNDIGYNWGWEIRAAEGMVNEEKCTDGGPVQGCGGRGGRRYNSGKSQTQLANPAKLFAFGNTYDTPRQTMGGVGWFFDDYPGGKGKNSGIYFGGQITVAYADGHAGTMPYKGGCAGSSDFQNCSWDTTVATPKDFSKRVDGFCADPDASINPFPRDGFPLGTGWRCRDFLAYPEAVGTTWWTD